MLEVLSSRWKGAAAMKGHEEFEHHLLTNAPETVPPGGNLGLRPLDEVNRFQISEAQIVQLTIEMWQGGLLSLHIWDGQGECSLQDWLRRAGNEHEFFYNTTDSGYVRVRLLAAGAAAKNRRRQGPIGFVAHR
jgi:hypothetical protein